MTLTRLGRPRDWEEARRFAAYFEAGRAVVAQALALGLLPQGTDLLHGYSVPDGEGADARKVERLAADHGAVCRTKGAELAEQQVKALWPQIECLARALESRGSLSEVEVRAFLT